LAQMLSTARQCAERMLDQGHFKVKVKVVGQTNYRVRSLSFEPLVRCANNSAQMSKISQCAVRMFAQGWV